MLSFNICESRPGKVLVPVEPSEKPSFGHRLSGGTSGSTKFVLTDDSVLNDETLTTPWSRMLVQSWNDVPRYAGLIVSDPYKESTDELTLHHVDIETFLSDSRYAYGVNSYWLDEPNHVPGSLTITNKSVRAAVGKIVEQCLLGPSDIYSFPIVLPNLAEVGTFSATYDNFNFETLGDHLANFRALGYDIEFEPRWKGDGTLEWLLRVGSTASPSLVGDVVDFNQTAERRPLTDVTYERDGTMQLTGQFGVGTGGEVLKRVGGDGIDGAATIPARDAVEYYPNETDEARLAAYGLAAVQANQNPTYNWQFSMPLTEGFELLRLGSIVRMHWPKRRRIPAGVHNTRLIGWQVRGDTVVCDVQTWG